jgi:hypothetical protein
MSGERSGPGAGRGLRLLVAIWLIALSGGATAMAAAVRATFTADVCIYGGTSAGVVAAVQAARMGKTVIVLEPGRHFGGMSVEGLGSTDIDNHRGFQNSPAVGGLAREFYRRVSARYGREREFTEMLRAGAKEPRLWRFEPHAAEAVFDAWLREHPIRALTEQRLADHAPVEKDGARLVAVRCASGTVVRAQMFIDATYEGDLLAAAGVSTTVGREGNARYGETKNGVQTSSTHHALDRRIDPYRVPGDPASGTIFTVSAASMGQQGEPSESVQAFCFRLCLTRDPANRIAIEKPANYDPAKYELQRRYLAAGGTITVPAPALPNGKTDPGSWHKLAGNMPGWNDAFATASWDERGRLLRAARDYVQGLYWFMAHDPAVPAELRAAWSAWGLCRDEFQDNAGWPRTFYVRNGRRMVSDFVLTEAHGRRASPEPIADSVGLVWWPHDLHEARRLVRDGAVWHEGTVFDASPGGDWVPFGMAYRALVPRAEDCTNLLTPTCPSASYVAYGAYRIEFQFMVAAQACATAAALAIDDGVTVQRVKYERLRARLLADGQVLAVP